jgi:hypothetical protein
MKSFKIQYLLIILCLVWADACFVSSRTSNETSNTTPTNSNDSSTAVSVNAGAKVQNEIRKVDFKNFTYEASCVGEEPQKITVKKGEYSLNKSDYDQLYFSVTDLTYGDLDGDQNEEAIVLTVCNTGGTGQFSEGFVYGLKDTKPELLARIEGGDRADGGLRKAKVENGLLVVERNGAGETGGACCPEFVVTSKYKLEGKNLKQVGGDERRELYPAQKVKFEKGASEAAINVKLTNDDDTKRFSVGAQAGQFLFASSNSKDVSITLVKGDADIAKDGDSLEATLKKSGEFVIQVQKISDKTVNASITIEIR